MRTLICLLVVIFLVGLMLPAFAVGLTDKEKLRDMPEGVLELISYDPGTMRPLMTQTPQGPRLLSKEFVPWGSIVLANPIVDLGERRVEKIEIRVDMAPVRVIEICYLKGWYPKSGQYGQPVKVKVNGVEETVVDIGDWLPRHCNYSIDTLRQMPGRSHSVQFLVIRRDEIYVSLLEKYFLSDISLEQFEGANPQTLAASKTTTRTAFAPEEETPKPEPKPVVRPKEEPKSAPKVTAPERSYERPRPEPRRRPTAHRAFNLTPARVQEVLKCEYTSGLKDLAVDDYLVAVNGRGQEVGLLGVTRVGGQYFWAKLLRGSAPDGITLCVIEDEGDDE